jgi:hypothetical protein
MVDNFVQTQRDHVVSTARRSFLVLSVPVDVERVEPRHRSFGIKVNCEDFSSQLTLIPDSRTPREPRREVANGDSKAAKALQETTLLFSN